MLLFRQSVDNRKELQMTKQAFETTGVMKTHSNVHLDEPLPIETSTAVRVIVVMGESSKVQRKRVKATVLRPLPVLEGLVPAGWKNAIYA